MRHKQKAFTLVELLVVIGIIALLLAIAMPAFNVVKTQAKKASMKAAISAMSVGLEQFKNDMGYYPDSTMMNGAMRIIGTEESSVTYGDTGAHHLANAMFGIDMLGYNKNNIYDIDPVTGEAIDREEQYVNIENLNVINFRRLNVVDFGKKVTELGLPDNWDNLNPIITDDFKPDRPRPVLYYRARTNRHLIGEICDRRDNASITDNPACLGFSPSADPSDPLTYELGTFEGFIWNPLTGMGVNESDRLKHLSARPYNKDSFLLISAGPDGLYGTGDDVCNFEVKE